MKRIYFVLLLVLLSSSCSKAEWTGRYISDNCMTLEFVELYEDGTADIRYHGSQYGTNHKMSKKGNKFFVNIYTFEYREDGKLYEIGGYDMGCVLTKDKSHGFWDRLFQP